jgi:predicted phosphate transport protein (TIGR00153 family)
MRIGLGARSGEIYELLTLAGASAARVVGAVEQRFIQWPSGPSQDEIKSLEHDCDNIVSTLLGHANTMFMTPFDRDDVVTLAFAIDDIADAAENASELLGLYGVETPTKQSFELCALLVRAADEVAALLSGLRSRDRADELVRSIKAIEDEGDEVARAARASLFKDDRIDPVLVIRWKDIYEALEEAIDACETAAHRVGNILVKNA